MESPNSKAPGGARLKALRRSLGLSTREVERRSLDLAEEKKNRDFFVSRAWLRQIENSAHGEHVPSIFKFYSLGAIYKRNWTELASFFDVRSSEIVRDQSRFGLPKTHLMTRSAEGDSDTVVVPLSARENLELEKTNLLTRLAAIWGDIPISLVRRLNPQESVYGYVGLEDFTMYPLLRPGSFVQLDPEIRKIQPLRWRTEYDRPIYFVESRAGYFCSWCEVQGRELLLLPHPLSPCAVRRFHYGVEAEIIGRVTGIAMRIVQAETGRPPESSID